MLMPFVAEVVMPMSRLEAFLKQNKAEFKTITHARAYTAPEVAESAHIQGQRLAKAVMLNIDGMLVMMVLPSNFNLSLVRMRDALAAQSIELASESEFAEHFENCELGALPPFGSLYGVPVYAAAEFDEQEEIAFSAGSHTQLLLMRWEEYLRLEKPEILVDVLSSPGVTPPSMRYRRGRARL